MAIVSVTKNKFFSYFRDDVSGKIFRSSDQSWSVEAKGYHLEIVTGGYYNSNYRNQRVYNGFAKKHLLTFTRIKGGRSSPEDKAHSIVMKRYYYAAENFPKNLNNLAEEYVKSRVANREKMSPQGQAIYHVDPMPSTTQHLTVINCEMFDSVEDLKKAFADPIAGRASNGTPSVKSGDEIDVKVVFKTKKDVAFTVDSDENIEKYQNEVWVKVYFELFDAANKQIRCHLVHLSSVAPPKAKT